MEWFSAEGFELARQVLQRGIAAVFLIAFASALAQFPALLGEHGLLPVPQLLERRTPRGFTLFRWGYTDGRLRAVAGTGVVISALLVAGLPQLGPPWLPLAAFLALWFLYMSIVNVGQTFYGFGWETLLLEAGFLAAFLGSDRVAPPAPVLWLFIWLVFRLEFGAGMIKMRGDTVWRDLTALYYHHETQPMPNPASWFFHHLPKPLHKVEVAGNHFAQLVVPFFLFFPQPVGSIAAAVVIITQLWLVASGNFAWLNTLDHPAGLRRGVRPRGAGHPAGRRLHTAVPAGAGVVHRAGARGQRPAGVSELLAAEEPVRQAPADERQLQ